MEGQRRKVRLLKAISVEYRCPIEELGHTTTFIVDSGWTAFASGVQREKSEDGRHNLR